MKKVLITGGAGFIGSNFIRYALAHHPDWDLTVLDKLTYAGNLENLKDAEDFPNYHFVLGDIADRDLVDQLTSQGFDLIVNFAAESHVDRGNLDPSPFITTNIQGTQLLLDGAVRSGVGLFLQVSTDEVYGSLESEGKFTEESPLLPNSPYAASKASADCLCRAYYHTYDLPVIITRCTNNYGPFQHIEKMVPLAVTNALEDKEIPVYGNGLNVRDWIYVEDHCRALDIVIQRGEPGQVYNVGADSQKTNLELVRQILDTMGKPHSLIKFQADRPGHDWRYALENTRIRSELGWEPDTSFESGLEKTVDWYMENEGWWRRIKSGEYVQYYEKMYSPRNER